MIFLHEGSQAIVKRGTKLWKLFSLPKFPIINFVFPGQKRYLFSADFHFFTHLITLIIHELHGPQSAGLELLAIPRAAFIAHEWHAANDKK
jgi:hypothetical protein